MKNALITGVTGQDGSYLAEFLLSKGYNVYGMVRRSSTETFERIGHIQNNITIVQGDLTDQSSLDEAIKETQADEVYNLAAQSFVATSWNQPVLTSDVTGTGVTKILEAIRKHKPNVKFYQASSSEMFGKILETPQNEKTIFYPRSPYGVAKVYGHYITKNYRESYNIFACSGILFNHESPRRGYEFVTRKITHAVAKIHHGSTTPLHLGNLTTKRDWGYAADYVQAMWLMLQQKEPDDYVISTGQAHSIKEFVEEAFKVVDITLHWEGTGLEEKGIDSHTGKTVVVVDQKYFRPADVDHLVGDSSKATRILGWKPTLNFKQLVSLMVQSDLELVKNNKLY